MKPDDRLSKVQQALRLAESGGDDQEKFELRESLGDIYLRADNYDQAIFYFDKILESEKWHSLPSADRARIWHKLALGQFGKGDFESALHLVYKGERILGGEGDSFELGKIYALAGRINQAVGNLQDALAYLLRSLYMLRHSPENEEIGGVQLACGTIFSRQGNHQEAVRYFQDALSTFRRIENEQGIAKANNNLGVCYKSLCQWDNATGALSVAMKIGHKLGDYTGVALRSLNLGLIRYHRGEWKSAEIEIEKSLQMSRAVGDSLGVTRCNLASARLDRQHRRWEDAKIFATEALRLSSVRGTRREIAASFEELGAWYFDRGQFQTAKTFFKKSLSVALDISDKNDHIAEVSRRLSEVAAIEGDADGAIDWAKRSLRMAVSIRDKRIVGLALRALGAAHRRAGDSKRAARYAGRSVRIFEAVGIPFELGRSLLESARTAQLLDDFGTARSNLTRAEAIFRRFNAHTFSCRALIEFAKLKTRTDRVEDGLVLLKKASRFLENDRFTSESREIEEIRVSIEERFVECSQAPSNRYLLIRESGTGRADVLARVLGPIGADRGVLFRRSSDGALRILEAAHFSEADALRVLGESLGPWEESGKAQPIASFSPDNGRAVRSYLVAPSTEAGDLGIYVDRTDAGGRGHFNRRDLNFLVGIASETVSPPEPEKPEASENFPGVITKNKKMRDILDMLQKLSGMHTTILIQGETGTGKGLIAYEVSKGNPGPFVTINCADLSETILESELFGHVKSAFTGATVSKKGLFEVADGGTVFIDEIDKTSRKFQEKLLRVVDRQEFKPVGSVKVRRVDCRIVCASNVDLREAVEQGRFLQDLFYRLKVICIQLPPLRERREDIPILSQHFLKNFTSRLGKEGVTLSPQVLDLLARYDWPGNVRDLENEIERAVALASPADTIGPEALSDELIRFDRGGIQTPKLGTKTMASVIAGVEKKMIEDALKASHNNKSKAARVLGLTRKGLRNKITRYGIDV